MEALRQRRDEILLNDIVELYRKARSDYSELCTWLERTHSQSSKDREKLHEIEKRMNFYELQVDNLQRKISTPIKA